MSVMTVARRYSEALADVAIERNLVEQIDSEVRSFVEMMGQNHELREVFASPVLSNDDKSRVLEALISRSNPGKMTANLLRTLLKHYRLHHLDAVYERFRQEINERRGILRADITTAGPVSEDQQTVLSRNIQEMTGKKVQLQFKSDPSLIGGVVTRIGSVVYDGSIRTQLETVKQRLKSGSI